MICCSLYLPVLMSVILQNRRTTLVQAGTAGREQVTAVGALGGGIATNNNGLSEAQAVTSQINEINYLEGVS